MKAYLPLNHDRHAARLVKCLIQGPGGGDGAAASDAMPMVVLGSLYLRRAALRDAAGSTIAQFARDGAVTGQCSEFVGRFRGATYRDQPLMALYLM